jgi:L-histidine Nalpha-methyltransferase
MREMRRPAKSRIFAPVRAPLTGQAILVQDFSPGVESFAAAVAGGLGQPCKSIPAKYFYDAQGSALFEEICALDEYYVTRTEVAVMAAFAAQIAQRIGPDCELIEFGSGASDKVRILLDALDRPRAYIAVDISPAALAAAAERIAADYPALHVAAYCADYTRPFDVPPRPANCGQVGGRRVGFFPGSTIGNFTPGEAVDFLAGTRALVGHGGAMLVGVDLKKDAGVLHAAYNDAKGVTAAFNLNLLARINRELGGDFDLAGFQHHAFYDAALGRIEMHLISRVAQTARAAGAVFEFAAGETIHTENSYKFGIEEFQDIARLAGFRPAAVWTDAARWFGVHYLIAE